MWGEGIHLDNNSVDWPIIALVVGLMAHLSSITLSNTHPMLLQIPSWNSHSLAELVGLSPHPSGSALRAC